MPDTTRTGTYKGKPTLGVLTGVGRDGTEYWKDKGLAFWRAVVENIDAIRQWVDRQEFPHGHDEDSRS